MKLSMIFAIGLFTLSFISPVIADTVNTDTNAQSMQAPSGDNLPNQSNDLLNSPTSPNNVNGDKNNASNDINPDTATGDDDY